MDLYFAYLCDSNNIALNGSNDAVLWTCTYQMFLQRLQNIDYIYRHTYDIQLHFQTSMWGNNNGVAGHSLDTPGLKVFETSSSFLSYNPLLSNTFTFSSSINL